MSEAICALSNDSLNLLGNLIEKKKLVLFAGSGISIGSEMPSWDRLSYEFLILCKRIFNIYKNKEELINNITKSIDEVKNNKIQDKSIIIDTISVYRNLLNNIINDTDEERVKELFTDWFRELFSGSNYNMNHKYIVSTNYPIILTTNYDNLLHAAIGETYKDLIKNNFGLKTYKDVARCIYEEESFIFHIHGKASEIDYGNIVLTKKDYVNIIRNIPSLRMLLETIFIKYAILFVGYGMSDPHLEDLLEEISFNFNYSEGNVRKFFIVIREDKVNFIRRNLKKMQGVTLLTVDENYEQSKELLKILSEKYPRKPN